MSTEWKFAFWENYQKDRITCKRIHTDADGKVHSVTATVSKYTGDSINPDWESILEQNTLEDIDAATKEREERHKRRHEDRKRREKERAQAKKLEQLFNDKLEIFEIPEIINSNNRPLKSKIRKSKNRFEMMAWTVMLLQDEMNNESKS